MAKDKVSEAAENIFDPTKRMLTLTAKFTIGDSVKKGTFVAKIPGIMQRAKIGVQRAKLLDGASSESLDAGTDNLIFIISYLDGLLIERPSWFNWDDIEDLAELRVLYDEVSEWERNFRSGIKPGRHERHSITSKDEEPVEGYVDL